MASSSAPVVQNPVNPMDLPPITTIGKSLIYTGDVMQFNIGLLKLRLEKMVDFESLKVNGFDIEDLFTNQGWKRYFDMLNGPIYTNMVKEFWMKAHVYDNVAAKQKKNIIKSVLAGLDITISRAHFAKLLDVKDQGKRISDYKNEIYYRQSIKKQLYSDENLAGKSKSMKDFYIVLFKILISNLIPRSGGTDTISWEHLHLLYFLKSGKKINLVDLLFEYLYQAVRDSNIKNITTLVYPRLLSELFFQTKLVKVLKKAYPE
ncbi:hypothetical protein A2U01_0027102, partial [Trifolium medium]|nr:hypothetical protein [Trifolium medium]